MKTKSARIITPLIGVTNSWEQSSLCKHFFPCNNLSGGYLTDVKGGVIIQPQTAKQFIFNASELSIIPDCDGSNSNKPATLVSGSWAELATGKAALLMCAGYIDSTYTANKSIRCALGDNNGFLELTSFQGFTMSDGIAGSGVCQHALIGGNTYDIDGTSFNGCANTAGGAAATGVTLDQDSYFIRYILYQPGIQVESKILTSAGVVSIDSSAADGPGGAALTQNGAIYVNAFRMHGFRCTGIALYHFDTDTVPSDYMTMVNYNGALWKTGVREIYPATGW